MRDSFDDDLPLEDPWFSHDAGAALDPELDDDWFSRGRPLSSHPPAGSGDSAANEEGPATSKRGWRSPDSDFPR
jgi:hypothetical protein